ncbi:MAG: AbiV family abortive infection protein [FCB group bacterium]|nr:AbiV family abortive infection protein [FCB group bacterium]
MNKPKRPKCIIEVIEENQMLSTEAKQHLEKYWQLSVQFFKKPDFALAAFFAITLIEEVGKVIILGNKEFGAKLDKKGFYNHRKKYSYAVYNTLFVNSRVSRIYGTKESRFAEWFRNGELFKIRNKVLYLELGDKKIRIPHLAISKEDAFLLVCIAGEVYAEIQGFYTGSSPTEWQRILAEIDTFREDVSI